ncbi:MAG: DUF2141 domain-containing protein [Anaerolineae bacterium]|jgi:uncharacterized protein (DUF2141 family)
MAKSAVQEHQHAKKEPATMQRRLAFAIAALAAVSTVAQPGPPVETGSIAVTVGPIKTDKGGNLIFALYNTKKTWLKLKQAYARVAVPPNANPAKVSFQNVPYGDAYALAVFHDKNGNGKLDMHFFPPRPKEGAGISNNESRMGKPRFSRAAFTVDKPTVSVEIRMRY